MEATLEGEYRSPAQRTYFLEQGLTDTLKWCVSPHSKVEGRKPSDQYWVELFRSSTVVTEGQVKSFFQTYKLTRMVKWNYPKVVDVIEEFRNGPIYDLSVRKLSEMLGKCTGQMRGSRTSAASKIAMFARTESDVFIWDSVVTRAARFRDSLRTGAKPRINGGLYSDYSSYSVSCSRALTEERVKIDFRERIDKLTDSLS